mmetsp:Transcript_139253/g.242364  ORF Transcript_139253/g.242364 Transcript_139253/m.242364 type:complete len:118 (-) Transcript_139253:7-360(-)
MVVVAHGSGVVHGACVVEAGAGPWTVNAGAGAGAEAGDGAGTGCLLSLRVRALWKRSTESRRRASVPVSNGRQGPAAKMAKATKKPLHWWSIANYMWKRCLGGGRLSEPRPRLMHLP